MKKSVNYSARNYRRLLEMEANLEVIAESVRKLKEDEAVKRALADDVRHLLKQNDILRRIIGKRELQRMTSADRFMSDPLLSRDLKACFSTRWDRPNTPNARTLNEI